MVSQAFKEALTEGTQWTLLSGILGGMCCRRCSLLSSLWDILENTNLASQEQELVDPPGRVKSQGGPESPS